MIHFYWKKLFQVFIYNQIDQQIIEILIFYLNIRYSGPEYVITQYISSLFFFRKIKGLALIIWYSIDGSKNIALISILLELLYRIQSFGIIWLKGSIFKCCGIIGLSKFKTFHIAGNIFPILKCLTNSLTINAFRFIVLTTIEIS